MLKDLFDDIWLANEADDATQRRSSCLSTTDSNPRRSR
jgi:hypothetical protein